MKYNREKNMSLSKREQFDADEKLRDSIKSVIYNAISEEKTNDKE